MKIIISALIWLWLISPMASAHQPVIVNKETREISNPEISRAFYDKLPGKPRSYLIRSEKDFALYLNLLVPKNTNPHGRYSAYVYKLIGQKRELIKEIDGNAAAWKEFFEPFGRDTYLKGPEFKERVAAGSYEIEVYSRDQTGKYVLAVGEKESFGPKEIAQVYWVIPILKADFFQSSPWSFLLTPFGIVLIIGVAILIFLIVKVRKFFRGKQKK